LALAEPGGPSPGPDTVAVAVGPEGGWSPAELEAVAGRVGLGPHVLRAETAAVVAGVLLVDRRAGAAR
jgi:16S rRNA (uracil1498-N3)-methyltransferase